MKHLISVIILLLFTSSCSNDNDKIKDTDDYLIFGHFYGMCAGEDCVETFKLTNKNLYEDTLNNYGQSSFSFQVLDNEKFLIAKDLFDFIPSELLSEENEFIGCPDCADGGGLYIEYSKNGKVDSWRIDQIKSEVPNYLHNFIDKINEKISLINE